jgi:hypothetical protein
MRPDDYFSRMARPRKRPAGTLGGIAVACPQKREGTGPRIEKGVEAQAKRRMAFHAPEIVIRLNLNERSLHKRQFHF